MNKKVYSFEIPFLLSRMIDLFPITEHVILQHLTMFICIFFQMNKFYSSITIIHCFHLSSCLMNKNSCQTLPPSSQYLIHHHYRTHTERKRIEKREREEKKKKREWTRRRRRRRRIRIKRCLLDELDTLLFVDIFFNNCSGKLNSKRRKIGYLFNE
jgi:uncharacterized membrane protein